MRGHKASTQNVFLNYVGPDGTGATCFSTAGEAISAVNGRYGRLRAFLTSTDGLATPELSDVQITHSGTSGSSVTRNTYDPAGNITEVLVITDAGVTLDERQYNDLNQIVSRSGGWTYDQDLDGNLTMKTNGTGLGDEKWDFTWDENSRLRQVMKGVYAAGSVLVNEFTVNYDYDERGRMLRREVVGQIPTTFTWDNWNLVGETTGASQTEYVVPEGLIHSFIRDGLRYQTHVDGLASVRMVTDAAGAVVARFEFGAFGETLAGSVDSVPGGLPYGFVGGLGVRTDAITGLIYMRNRWFSVQLQTFISRDPIGLSAGANLYTYCGNDPLGCVDPDGLDVEVYVTHDDLVTGGHVFLRIVGPGYDYTADRNTYAQAPGSTGGSSDNNKHSSGELVGMTQPAKINFPRVSSKNLETMKPQNLAHRYKTTKAQDEMIIKIIKEEQANPKPFNVFYCSCATFARDCLIRSGIDPGLAYYLRGGYFPGLSPYDVAGGVYEAKVPTNTRPALMNQELNAPDRVYPSEKPRPLPTKYLRRQPGVF